MMIRPVHLLAVCLAGQLSTAGVVVLAREHPLLVSPANSAAAQAGPAVAANAERTSYGRVEARLAQMERAFNALERERDRFAERSLRLAWQQLLSEMLREHSGVFARERVSGAGYGARSFRADLLGRDSIGDPWADSGYWDGGSFPGVLEELTNLRDERFSSVGADGIALLDELGASLEQLDAVRGGRFELASGGEMYAALDSVLAVLGALDALSGRGRSRGALAGGYSGDSFSGALDSVTVLLDELNELQAGRQRASLADRFGQVLGEGGILENRQRGTALLFLWL